MIKELQEIVCTLTDLNSEVNEQIFPTQGLRYLENILKKMNARIATLNKQLDTLYAMDLDFNNNQVIALLIGVHHNLSQLIICVETIHNAISKTMCNYEEEWRKIND